MEMLIIESKIKLVLLPDHPFLEKWNVLMIGLLVYVATYVPYSVCFIEPSPNGEFTTREYVDLIVDLFFMADIFINFISAYENEDTQLPIVDIKKIARNYF